MRPRASPPAEQCGDLGGNCVVEVQYRTDVEDDCIVGSLAPTEINPGGLAGRG